MSIEGSFCFLLLESVTGSVSEASNLVFISCIASINSPSFCSKEMD